MATVMTHPVGEPPTQRRWGTIAGAILAALVLLAGLTWVAFTSLYSPIEPNGVGGGRGGVQLVGDRWNETEAWGLTGPVNGTGEVLIGVENRGPLPIRILRGGMTFPWGEEKVRVDVRWSPDLGEHADEVRPFPVTVRPGEQLMLVIEVPKRGCYYDRGTSGGPIIRQIPLRWSVLGRERTHKLDADKPDTGMMPINVCPPADVK